MPREFNNVLEEMDTEALKQLWIALSLENVYDLSREKSWFHRSDSITQIVKQLRESPTYASIKGNRDECSQAGFEDFSTKDVDRVLEDRGDKEWLKNAKLWAFRYIVYGEVAHMPAYHSMFHNPVLF